MLLIGNLSFMVVRAPMLIFVDLSHDFLQTFVHELDAIMLACQVFDQGQENSLQLGSVEDGIDVVLRRLKMGGTVYPSHDAA
jgi:hypothetical protein